MKKNMDPKVGSVSIYDVDELIATLQAWGISYLVGLEPTVRSTQLATDQQSVVASLQRLAQCDEYPRVRDAIIALLLLHPEIADSVQQALRESTPEISERIAVLTLATLYLQRLWSLRLTIALAHPPDFPEQPFAFLWEKRHLPSPACHYGNCGLLALEEAERQRTGLPFTFIGDWQNQVNQLLAQEETKRRHNHTHLSLLALPPVKTEEYREIERLQINIEFAAPGDFIPLPRQWETHAQFVGRYGTIDVFYFDFYSIALSKIERGNDRDIADVKLLIQHGIINFDELDKSYQEVLVQLGKGRYPRIIPQRFAERYQTIRQLLC